MSVKEILSVTVRPPPIHYEVVFGENLLEQALLFVKAHGWKPLLITTSGMQHLLPHVKEEKIVLPHGETIKCRAMKEKVEDALIERGCGRDSCLIAVGGGALLDLVGFVAATYCRGIPYVSMPVTLIAMTDASLGGKTSVNVEEAKNWIGAFHHPRKVFIDFTFLHALSQKECIFGLSETIKHSLIADRTLFSLLEEKYEELLSGDLAILKEVVLRSCAIKKEIVEQDPYETKGIRKILGFGHTIGHALETLSNYTRPHGQAILMGMRVEALLARRLGYLSSVACDRISTFLHKLPVGMDFPEFLPYEMMVRDKKGAYQFVVLTGIGSVAPFDGEYATSFTKGLLEEVWKDLTPSLATSPY